MKVKTILLGKALTNDQLQEEKLSRLWGLPIMSSDAISSVAYAVEEILRALVPLLGITAVSYVGFVGVPIIILLLLLIFSYTQIINHYPNGGGSYVVSKENFGHRPAMLAATCLIVDYIMTVVVSISSSTAAIVAAFPMTAPYAVLISLVSLALITLINLRGATESSKIFGVPTYAFIISMIAMIVFGFARLFTGSLHAINYSATQQAAMPKATITGITLLLFLKAFSAGCSALTGVEAVSNAVPSFKDPPQRTAKHVLFLLGACIFFIFGGTSFLATALKVMPMTGTTVMAQMATAIFGKGFIFYWLQATTALILLLAANTAYNGLPTLLSLIAKDHYMPHQFSQRGTKLSFSNGVMFLCVVSGLLLIIFDADTNRAIPFYAVGVFISFTLAQSGMFSKWVREKEKGWQYKSLINGIGAIVTFVGTIVIFSSKFLAGAWMLLIAMPLIAFFMSFTHRHYQELKDANSLEGYEYHNKPGITDNAPPFIVLIHTLDRATLKTLNYAKNMSSDITALHICTTPRHTQVLKEQWVELGIDITLSVIDAPYRDVLTPLDLYITEREEKLEKDQELTVVLTKYVECDWWEFIFHNQTTLFIEHELGKHNNVATILVPYLYQQKNTRT